MIEYTNPTELTDEAIERMSVAELIQNAPLVYDLEDEVDRAQLQAKFLIRAGVFRVKREIQGIFTSLQKENRALDKVYSEPPETHDDELDLDRDKNGAIASSIDNIHTIFANDPRYKNIRFNLLTNSAEIHTMINGKPEIRRWSDADEAASRNYIEKRYNIYNERKHADALRIFFNEREYNPIMDIVENLEWDGENRCERFLARWAKVEDTPYTREVSRLIFAGGINRLYVPGCKFEDIPVLVGTKQGEGKSSLIRFLALHDDYFGEIKDVNGQQAIEQLAGKWVLEIAELSAFTKVKDVESIKAFISRQRDQYRKPYDRQVSELPRRCVFIGTTNNAQFLVDKTGNRRYYPVTVNSNGYDLYDHEQEIRQYICQCWAEARERFKRGEMKGYADKELYDDYQKAQEDAMQDDWRVGAIEGYLESLPIDSLVCVRQIKHEALCANPDFPVDPTPKESKEITMMMAKYTEWERVGVRKTTKYGKQRCWKRIKGGTEPLPFEV